MDVGVMCGSKSPRSSNAAALEVAARHLSDQGHTPLPIPSPLELPAFAAEQSAEPPDIVAGFQTTIRAADVVLIAAPEYANGLAGSTKNALDWLVGDGTLYHTLVGVLSAGTTGGSEAIRQLVLTLSWQGAFTVATLGIDAPRTKTDTEGRYNDPATISDIRKWADTVVGTALADRHQRVTQITSTLEPFGVDPARFGQIE